MTDHKVYSYALLARDRATGLWSDQNDELGPRVVGTWDYVFNRGFRACWYYNANKYSEVMIKRIHLKCVGGDGVGQIPTLSVTQEVVNHVVLMPVKKPRLGKMWTRVEGQHYEVVVLADNGERASDYEVKVAFLTKE